MEQVCMEDLKSSGISHQGSNPIFSAIFRQLNNVCHNSVQTKSMVQRTLTHLRVRIAQLKRQLWGWSKACIARCKMPLMNRMVLGVCAKVILVKNTVLSLPQQKLSVKSVSRIRGLCRCGKRHKYGSATKEVCCEIVERQSIRQGQGTSSKKQ